MTALQELDTTPAMERDAESGVLTTAEGQRIGYLIRGPEDGRRVVYLHGTPSSRLEQLFIPERSLERFGIRLISFDRPGYGHTDPLGGGRVAKALAALRGCDGLGVRSFPVIAVSGGGSYALTLAAAAPERVERVILAGANMPYDDEAAITGLQPHQLALLPALRGGRNPALVAGIEHARAELIEDPISAFSSNTATLSARERAWYEEPSMRELFIEDFREALRASAEGLLADLLLWPQPFELDLAEVRCPVRAVHGTADDWEPLGNLRRVLAGLQDAQAVLLEGLNHFGPLMHPDLLLSLATASD